MADRIRTELGGNITVGAGPIVDGERLFFLETERRRRARRGGGWTAERW